MTAGDDRVELHRRVSSSWATTSAEATTPAPPARARCSPPRVWRSASSRPLAGGCCCAAWGSRPTTSASSPTSLPTTSGLQGIDTLDQLAEVKAIVTTVTKPDGWVVLNGEDPRVWAMRHRIKAKPWAFSLDPDAPALRESLARVAAWTRSSTARSSS